MRSMINIMTVDDATVVKVLWLFKIGFIHPLDAPGKVRGIILGFWRFEIQLILGFWNKSYDKGVKYHA